MKLKTKALSAALAATMALSMAPSTALAEYHGYSDLDASHWAVQGGIVDWATVNGAVSGYPDGTWAPNETCSRGMAVTIVWRLAGEPEAASAPSFSDVNPSDWYYNAVAWAASEGIVSGVGDTGTFAPNDPVTREQVAKIMALWCGADTENETADLSAYKDPASVSDWALGHVGWAIDNGVISGVDAPDGLYVAGQSNCTRAEFATMAARVVDGVQAGVDLAGKKYVVDAVWNPEYGTVEVPVYEDVWVGETETVEWYFDECINCGRRLVSRPANDGTNDWLIRLDDGSVVRQDSLTFNLYSGYFGSFVDHYGKCGFFPGAEYGVDYGYKSWTEIISTPTGNGHWESQQTGTKTETVEVGGYWTYENGRWE